MIVAGKCPPEPRELAAARDRGFDHVELYLTRGHLDAFDRTLDAVDAADVQVASVHTPHVSFAGEEYPRYVRRSDELARSVDAYLVVHSKHLNHLQIPLVEELEPLAPHGYENNAGASARHLEHVILRNGHDLVLDTAHLFMAETDAVAEMERLLDRFSDRIAVVHCCDSTVHRDGLPLGAGQMDVAGVVSCLDRCFDGTVVLEVMPEHQRDALETFREYADRSPPLGDARCQYSGGA